MANATFNQTNFTAGQVSELIYGRTDFSKFYNGVATLQNFIVKKQGPISRRPGTKYVADAKDSTGIKRLIPFQFSTSQTYMLEFGDKYIRFYRDRDQLMDDGSLKSDGTSSTPFEIQTLYTSDFSKTITASSVDIGTLAINFSGTPSIIWGARDGLPEGIAFVDGNEGHGILADAYMSFDNVTMTPTTPGTRLINTTHTALYIPTGATAITFALDTDPGSHSSGGTAKRETTADVTVGASHGFTAGMLVNVSGTNRSSWDGIYRVRKVDSTTITIPVNKIESSSAAWSADEVTLTVPSGHGVKAGDSIKTGNFAPAELNSTFTVASVTATTIVYALTPNPTITDGIGDIQIEITSGTVSTVDSSVDKLTHAQSADVLLLSSGGGSFENERPQELQRLEGFNIADASYYTADAAKYNTGTVTLTIATEASPHGFHVHNPAQGSFSKIIVSGVTPSEYNGCYNITAVTDSTVSYSLASDPGAMTVSGTVSGWQLIRHQFKDGPYLDENLDTSNTILISGSGVGTDAGITLEDKKVLDSRDYGRWFKHKYLTNDWGNGEIRFVGGQLSFFAHNDLNADFTDGSSSVWRLGAWSDGIGWPWTVSFLQGRLAWGGSPSLNSTFWASVTNDINNHRPFDKDTETVSADDGIVRTIDDSLVNAIYWMLNTPRGLIIGTDSAEFLIGQTSTAEALSNNNIESKPQTFFGSKRFVLPVRVGDTAILFVQHAGRKVIELLYSFDVDKFASRDLTVLSDDITKSGIIDIAHTAEPSPLLWCALDNGKLACCTYEREQDVISWHEHILGGVAADGDDRPKVKSVGAIFDDSGDEPISQLWLIARRKINGSTTETIEFMEDEFETGDSLEDAFYVDSGVTWTGASTTTIPIGLHLEGETVRVLADGLSVADKVVDGSGDITLSVAATKVQAGLPFTSKMATLPIELRQDQPESRHKVKRLERAHVLFLNSQGVQFGISEDSLEDVPFDDATSLHSDLVEDMLIQAPYERDEKFWLVNSGVFPTTIRSLEIELEVQPIQG